MPWQHCCHWHLLLPGLCAIGWLFSYSLLPFDASAISSCTALHCTMLSMSTVRLHCCFLFFLGHLAVLRCRMTKFDAHPLLLVHCNLLINFSFICVAAITARCAAVLYQGEVTACRTMPCCYQASMLLLAFMPWLVCIMIAPSAAPLSCQSTNFRSCHLQQLHATVVPMLTCHILFF